MYALPGAEFGEHRSLVEVCRRVPHGVVCLLSALEFHGLTTQMPFEVWMAIGPKARKPKLDHPPLRIVRFPPPYLNTGVERHLIGGVTVKVTDVPRIVRRCGPCSCCCGCGACGSSCALAATAKAASANEPAAIDSR